MGAKPSTIMKSQADHPFPLIVSPRYKRGIRDIANETGAFNIANEMVLVHNCMIRGRNSIYLQAPNVQSATDIADFLTYMHSWSLLLHMHHETEETVAFPLLEGYIQQKGFMDRNVEQHHAFAEGVDRFDGYVKNCKEGRERFDGKQVQAIVDGFGAVLTQHLMDEIGTLPELEQFEKKIDWVGFNKQVLKKAVDEGDAVSLSHRIARREC
jgi:hemerythrin-like domain-containing protein